MHLASDSLHPRVAAVIAKGSRRTSFASPARKGDVSNIPCKFFKENKCTRDNCPYLHDASAIALEARETSQEVGPTVAVATPPRHSVALAVRVSHSMVAAAVLVGMLTCVVPAGTTTLLPPSVAMLVTALAGFPVGGRNFME